VENGFAKCNKCNKAIVYMTGTNGMIGHLRLIHNINEKTPNNNKDSSQAEPCAKKQKLITAYSTKTSLEEEVSRLACVGNLTFNQIASTPFIRRNLILEFPDRKVPKYADGISDLIVNFADDIKNTIRNKIDEMKKNGTKFSASLDEWTSRSNRRFLNINLHFAATTTSTDHINLGMIEMDGKCPAEKLVIMVSCNFINLS
jgi:flagellar hook-associated protein FlgK